MSTSSSQRSPRFSHSLSGNIVSSSSHHSKSTAQSLLQDHYGQIFKNQDIIAREWFFTKIDKILDIHSASSVSASSNVNPTIKNVTVVFGGPATGKTFLFQLLLARRSIQNQILLPFFCQSKASTPADLSPSDNPLSLIDFTSALAKKIKELFGIVITNPCNDKKLFRDDFLVPLSTLTNDPELSGRLGLADRRYLILIDSIDLRPDICELLAENHHYLPSWLHVVISARPKRYRIITKLFSGARKVALDDIKKTNVYEDLFDYLIDHKADLQRSIELSKEQQSLKTIKDIQPTSSSSSSSALPVPSSSSSSPSPAKGITKELLNRIIAKSNGSVLFIKLLLKSLSEGIFSLENFDTVGATLNGIYFALFVDLFNKYSHFEADFRAVLGSLDRSNDFRLSDKALQQRSGVDKEDGEFSEVLEALSSHFLLDIECSLGSRDTEIRLVHPTLFEWLSDVKHCTERFLCHEAGVQRPQRSKQALMIHNKFIQEDPIFDENGSRSKRPKDSRNRIVAKTPKNFQNSRGAQPNIYDDYGNNNIEEDYDEEEEDDNGSDMDAFQERQQFDVTNVDLKEVSKEFVEKLQLKFESALQQNDLKSLRNILEEYHSLLIDQSFIGGKTPMYWAIKKNNIKMVELFIEYGANVNGACDVERWTYTPLVIALIQNSYEICELLLDNDADVDLAIDSLPPLANAITFACSPEVVRLLLYWGAGTDFLDDSGRSLLHFAAYEPRTWPETIGLLLTVGCDEMHRDNIGQTALHVAAQNGSIGTVEVLVEIGGDRLIHTADKAGQLPIHIAITANNDHLVGPLLTGKSINALAHDGNSPLRLAILNYNLELAQMLIGRGADVNYRDPDGRSIVYCVVAFAHSTLENKGPPFFNAFTLNRAGPDEYLRTVVRTLEFLVRFGADLELKDLEGRTPLHVAAWQGAPTIVDSLVALGAEVDALDSEGRTPLHMCSWNGHLSVVRLLVESGAAVGQISSTQGATPLLVAAQQGHLDTCRYLVRVGGSKVNHRDLYGRDARDVAATCGHNDIVNVIDRFLADSKAGLVQPNDMKVSKYDSRYYNSNPVQQNHSILGSIGGTGGAFRSGSSAATASATVTANTVLGLQHPPSISSLSVDGKAKKNKSSGMSKLTKMLNP